MLLTQQRKPLIGISEKRKQGDAMRAELTAFRSVMKQHQITVWCAPCSDAHGSEYIGARDQVVSYLSGFTGDSCILLILENDAFLWTDGRYFVQAEQELRNSGVRLMKLGEPEVPSVGEFLKKRLTEHDTLGYYAPLLRAPLGAELRQIAKEKKASLRTEQDLVEQVWKARPKRSCQPIWQHELQYAGVSAAEKLKRIREEMRRQHCSVFLTEALDETAWLTNLRGSDIACNPLFLSYLIVKQTSCGLYVQKEALSEEGFRYLKCQHISAKPYTQFFEAANKLENQRILVDRATLSDAVNTMISEKNDIVDCVSPLSLWKAVKNPTEAEGMRRCHIRDGVYVTKFLYWLHQRIREEAAEDMTERAASDYLDSLRASDERYVSLSFPTISAYGENGALPHYQAKAGAENETYLRSRGLYLVDSGAQYLDGTTDITRTVSLGETTAEERQDYTLAVIGMLRLMHAVFPFGARGTNLDTYARQEMWKLGRDFKHGTGHGVGALNTVHEPPVSVRFRPSLDARRDRPFVPGMVTSDEPGIYVAGSHGVRMENLILCVPHEVYGGFYRFETLTMAPLDPRPLDLGLMSDEDIKYFNDYQKAVRKTIGPLLNQKERDWLKDETGKIKRSGKRKKKDERKREKRE